MNRIYENKNLPCFQLALMETFQSHTRRHAAKGVFEETLGHTYHGVICCDRSISFSLLDTGLACSPAQTPRGKFRRTTKSKMPRGNFFDTNRFLSRTLKKKELETTLFVLRKFKIQKPPRKRHADLLRERPIYFHPP
jgi:hypothetical protein